MTQIHKYQSKYNFTIVNNIPIVELSPLALGVLTKILRLHNAEMEKITVPYIQNLTGLTEEVLTNVLSELRRKGYAVLYRKQKEKGRFASTYEFSEYPSEKFIGNFENYKEKKVKETEKMMQTQQAKGNFHFHKYRHLAPHEKEKKYNMTEKSLLKQLQEAAKPAAREYLRFDQPSEIIEKYTFAHRAMIVYDFFLFQYHQQKMVWTSTHGKRFIEIIKELESRIGASTKREATEQEILIHLSFFLTCVLDEHKEKGSPQKFFPGLLAHTFIQNWANYASKRVNYYKRGKMFAPDFVLEYLEDAVTLSETEKLLGIKQQKNG